MIETEVNSMTPSSAFLVVQKPNSFMSKTCAGVALASPGGVYLNKS